MANKPFDLTVLDTKNELIEVINRSGLPYSLLNYIIAELKTAIDDELNKSLPQLRENYNRELAQEVEDTNIETVEAEIVRK